MFGVAPIRTRTEQMELAHAGTYPHSHTQNDMGAGSALLRTTTLLESISKQQKYVVSNLRLTAESRSDELAALELLRSCLTRLHSCIRENENPPPSISKRKVLIKVEKARREVLAAVRECSGRVTESQKLLDEIERFIELRPDEPVSPRQFNIKWSRLAPFRPIPRSRRDQAYGRVRRPGDSLVASIVGLSAIAEGRERDTPTSDVGGHTTVFVPAADHAPTAKVPPLSPPRPCHLDQHQPVDRRTGPVEIPAGQPETPVVEGAAPGATQSRKPTVSSSSAVGAQAAVSHVSDPAAKMQKLQIRPRVTEDSDAGDDLMPSLSHDVGQSSATTMCNLDSCVSGPNRAPTSRQVTAGGEAAESRRRSYEDDDDDGDEVNSAEGRHAGLETGSPNHRVALLGAQRGAATMRSTAGTTQSPALSQQQSHVGVTVVSGQPTASTGRGVSVGGGYGGGFATVSAADLPLSAKAAEAAMRAQDSELLSHRSYNTATTDQRRRQSVINIGAPMPVPHQHHYPHQGNIGLGSAPGTTAVAPATSQGLLAEGTRAAVAAAELDAIDAIAAAAAQQAAQAPAPAPPPPVGLPPRYASAGAGRPPIVPTSAAVSAAALPATYNTAASAAQLADPYQLAQAPHLALQQQQQQAVYQAQAYAPLHHPVLNVHAAGGYPAGAAAYPHGGVPGGPPAQYHQGYPAAALPPPQMQVPAQVSHHHPAAVAAAAAAASHPYGANGVSHPYMGVLNGAGGVNVSGGGAYSLPPSGPSSLRDYPLGPHPGSRPGTAATVMVPGHPGGMVPHRRLGSQPPSGHHSLDSGQYPASATAWDNVSLAETEPLPGAAGQGAQRGRRGSRRRGGGLFGIVRNVVGFVGVSMLSGAAMVLGAAAVNTGLDEQEAANQARQQQKGPSKRGNRIGRGGDDLIPQRTLQQLRSPDLLALGRG